MAERTYRQTLNRPVDENRPTETRLSFLATLDWPMLLIVGLLVTIGSGMVFSTTFDWSLQEYGSNTTIFMRDHMRNVGVAVLGLLFFTVIDYRFWKRFTPLLLLVTVGALIAVLLFGDVAFGARRSLIGGRFQPGELAEFTVVMYLSAWLGAKNARPQSLTSLVAFGVIVSLLAGLVALQPDLSSAAVIVITALVMFYLAGARVWHLGAVFGVSLVIGLLFVQSQPYAQNRIASFTASLADPTQANWQTQQAIIAFVKGGWLGVGLGQGEQKFGFLPAPHTDSIFAVIGEELGVVGAAFVVLLFVAFVMRGFQIARRSVDPFGALLCIGFTMWVAIQALLNIAVMTAVIPTTGLPLPFISYGGSALLVLMCGVGFMLSVSRVAAIRQHSPNRRVERARDDRGWRDGRTRLPRTSRGGSVTKARR